MTDDREIVLRYSGACSVCGASISKGSRAVHVPSERKVRHLDCLDSIDRGVPGGSARREHERRAAKDAARVAEQKANVQELFGTGFVGKVATRLAVDDSPRRSTQVWTQGAVGEERVAAQLDSLAEFGVVALHDRGIPRSRANIDHLVITPWAVWVVDAKRYLNKSVRSDVVGGFLGIGGTERLLVGGRNQPKLVDGVLRQVDMVRNVVGGDIDVFGCLCFVQAEWPLIGGAFTIRGVRVCWPKRLAKTLLRTDPPTLNVEAVSRALATAFPPA